MEKKTEKKKTHYRLLDFRERGEDAALGLPAEDGQTAPLVDALQRVLWLMEYHPSAIPDFLRKARANTEQMRLVAQALAGPEESGCVRPKVGSIPRKTFWPRPPF
jgi:hypothetical protein